MKKQLLTAVIFIMALALMLSFQSYSYDGIIAVDDRPEGIFLEGYTLEYINIKSNVRDLVYKTHILEGNIYSEVLIPGESVFGEIGDPLLPVFYKLIQVPESGDFRVTYSLGKEFVVDILAETGAEYLYPVQHPVSKTPQEIEFMRNEDAYAIDEYLPRESLVVNEEIRARGRRLIPLTIFPVKYNPVNQTIIVYSEIDISIQMIDSDPVKTGRMINRYSSSFSEIYDMVALGSMELKNTTGNKGFNDEGILIITADGLYSGLSSFVEWKEKKGYRVTLTKQSDIASGSTTTGIKNYIQNAYNTWDIPPSSVILVGDTDTIPTYSGGSSGTAADVYYVYLEGSDYFPDAGISRISLRTLTDLATYMNKLLYYEQYGNPDLSWMNDAALISGEDYGYYHIGEGTMNWIASTYLDPYGWDYDKLYRHTYNTSKAEVISSMNAGKAIANFTAHCSSTSWAFRSGQNIGISDINALTNQNMYFFAVGNCCQSGRFTDSECIGETFIRANNAAIAYWGASNNSMWDEDDILAKKSFDGFFAEKLHKLDQNVNYAKIALWNHYSGGGSSRYYMDMYNLLGDGTTFMPTLMPVNPSVNCPDITPVGSASINVSVQRSGVALEGALVSAYNPAIGVRGAARTDSSGMANVVFDTVLNTSGTFLVVVTHPNIINYEKTVMIGSSSDGNISFDAEIYSCGSHAGITLSDEDLEGQGTHSVTVSSTTNPSGVNVILNETDFPGVYEGSVHLGTDIAVSHNDILTVTYYDEDTGDGTPGVKTDTAVLDCQGPVIYDIEVSNITGDSAEISFATNEPAISTLHYGPSPDNLPQTIDVSINYVQDHSVLIDNLQPNTRYYYLITAQDSAGNSADTGCYSFMTLNVLNIGNGSVEIVEAPIYTYYHDNRTQVIYTAGDLGNNAFSINSLAIHVSVVPSLPMNSWTIRMKHTAKNDYESSAVFETDGWTVVYQANVTISQTGWHEFTFSSPFDYDGVQNLMVDLSFNNSSWQSPGGKTYWTGTPTKRAIYAYSDSDHGDPLNWPTSGNPTVYSTNNYVNLKLGLLSEGPDPTKAVVYRFFNSVQGGHLYTISEIERDYIIDNLPQWSYEGPKFQVYEAFEPESTAAYRFFNTITGIHLYTISEVERDAVMQLPEWNYEGIKFFVHEGMAVDTIPVFRFFNHVRGGHLFTISEIERDAVMQLPEWTYEGVPFYVFSL